MNKKSIFLSCVLLLVFSNTFASTSDCQDLYVGKIWVEKGYGLRGVVFLNAPQNNSGSYWVWFSDWTLEEKGAALSTLMAAKFSGHRINLTTSAEDGCSISSGQYGA